LGNAVAPALLEDSEARAVRNAAEPVCDAEVDLTGATVRATALDLETPEDFSPEPSEGDSFNAFMSAAMPPVSAMI
jgi:hypothetical protein